MMAHDPVSECAHYMMAGMATKAKGNTAGERGNPCPEKGAPSGLNNGHIYIFP